MNTQLIDASDKIDLKTEMPEPLPLPKDTGGDPALPPKDLWNRQSGESAAAFALFTEFLELGADSTLADLAEKTGRTLMSIRHMGGRHNWTERAAAWRQHLAHAAHEAREQGGPRRGAIVELQSEASSRTRLGFWQLPVPSPTALEPVELTPCQTLN